MPERDVPHTCEGRVKLGRERDQERRDGRSELNAYQREAPPRLGGASAAAGGRAGRCPPVVAAYGRSEAGPFGSVLLPPVTVSSLDCPMAAALAASSFVSVAELELG